MATLKDIRRRIASIKSTQQITKAMKMVAAAKLRRAQQRIFSARPYSRKINELIQNLLLATEDFEDQLLEEREGQKVLLVVVTSDRGLCGSFNSNIIKRTMSVTDSLKDVEIQIAPVGRKGYDFFKKRDYKLGENFINFFNDLELKHAEEIVHYLTMEFIEKRADKIKLIYNEFKSAIQQNLIVEDFLPIHIEESENRKHPDFLYEPSQDEILRRLLPQHLKMQVWRTLLESFAAEQGARMTAMENATDNATI
jgi:F-type H+-transporting ATPase subunit gamma